MPIFVFCPRITYPTPLKAGFYWPSSFLAQMSCQKKFALCWRWNDLIWKRRNYIFIYYSLLYAVIMTFIVIDILNWVCCKYLEDKLLSSLSKPANYDLFLPSIRLKRNLDLWNFLRHFYVELSTKNLWKKVHWYKSSSPITIFGLH